MIHDGKKVRYGTVLRYLKKVTPLRKKIRRPRFENGFLKNSSIGKKILRYEVHRTVLKRTPLLHYCHTSQGIQRHGV